MAVRGNVAADAIIVIVTMAVVAVWVAGPARDRAVAGRRLMVDKDRELARVRQTRVTPAPRLH